MNFRRSFAVLALVFGLCAESRAGFILEFKIGEIQGITNLTVVPSDIVNFQIFLKQTDLETRLTSDGLLLFDAQVTSNNASFGDPLSAALAPSFLQGTTATEVDGEAFKYGGVADNNDTTMGVKAVGASNSVLLGSGTFSVDSLASGSTTLTLAGILNSPSFLPFVIAGPEDTIFDTDFNPTPAMLTLQVAPVPEASSLVLAGLAMVAGGIQFRRRRAKRA